MSQIPEGATHYDRGKGYFYKVMNNRLYVFTFRTPDWVDSVMPIKVLNRLEKLCCS